VRDVRGLNRRIVRLEEQIREEVEASGTTLSGDFGVGPVLAAKIVGFVGNIARFPSTRGIWHPTLVSPPSRPPAGR
jgi:transposase